MQASASEERAKRATKLWTWEKIRQGDPIPEGAVHAGRTATDGIVYVALSLDGDCGKLNADLLTGKANHIYCSGMTTPDLEGSVLVKTQSAIAAWRAVRKGQRLPDRAMFAGERFGDGAGPMYVARSGSESGRLLLDGTLVKEIQCHHKGNQEHGEVLVFDPCLLAPKIDDADQDTSANPVLKSENWQARWMWNDAGLPTALIPGPLRTFRRLGPQWNPLRWSNWQDLPSTFRDLQGYRDTAQAMRPVRIETSIGICDVYECAPDLVLTLSRILTGDA